MYVSGQLHSPAAVPPGKEPLVLIGCDTGWAPEPVWSGRGGKEENSQPLSGIESPACSPVLPAPSYVISTCYKCNVLASWKAPIPLYVTY